jgi:hypothetical protein
MNNHRLVPRKSTIRPSRVHLTLLLPPRPRSYHSLGSCALSCEDEGPTEVRLLRLGIDGVDRDNDILSDLQKFGPSRRQMGLVDGRHFGVLER